MRSMMLVPRNHGFFDDSLSDPFDSFFGSPVRSASRKPLPTTMRTDIKETESSFEIDIDLPGFKKENVRAEIEDGYLTIEASTESSSEEKNDEGTYLRKERFSGKCRRSFYVGEDISDEDIRAKFEDGILSVTVPKKQQLPEPET